MRTSTSMRSILSLSGLTLSLSGLTLSLSGLTLSLSKGEARVAD